MLMIHTSLFTLPKQLVRVWRNEFTRCICDRLSSEQVRCFFKRINDDNSNAILTHNLTRIEKSVRQRKNTRHDFRLIFLSFTFPSSSSSYFWFFSYLVCFYFVPIVVGDFHASWISFRGKCVKR